MEEGVGPSGDSAEVNLHPRVLNAGQHCDVAQLDKLAHVSRSDTALAKHLWTARQRALHAYCVSCTLTAAKGAMLQPALGLKGLWAA
jgi:hypothetical protein